MNTPVGASSEPSTWAQSIQAYQRDKSTLSWNPAEVPPPSYVKQFDVSRKTREMDPVLMRHRSPEVEANRVRREEERVRVALNKARSRQLRVEQPYNIVTHSSHLPGKQEPAVRPARHPDSRTNYDILNHVPRENAHSVALIYADGETPELLPQRAVTVEGEKKPRSHMKRDVDILSNRFLEKHEERAGEEKRFLQSKAEEKYRLTHDYNPIAGTYYDQGREQHFAQSREKLQALQGRAQQHRLPPSIRYGEGNDYNIINQQPKNTRTTSESAAAAVVADRGLTKRTQGRKTHAENVLRQERSAEVRDQRTLNRPSHMRHVETLRTGHDVISNRVFTGRKGKPPREPRARPLIPVWDRLARPEAAVGAEAGAGVAVARCGGTGEALAREQDGGGYTDADHHPHQDHHRNRNHRGSSESGGFGDSGAAGGRSVSGNGDLSRGQGKKVDDLIVAAAASRPQRGGENVVGPGGGGRVGGGGTEAAPGISGSRTTSRSKPNVPPLNLSRQPNTGPV